MTDFPLPQALESVFTDSPEPEKLFATLLPTLCQVLQVDRCFLHLRDPHTRLYRNLCWRRSSHLPDTSTAGWEQEEEWEKVDPMFAAALRAEDSIFIEDIETAKPGILNIEFERHHLGHRALVHAHLRQEGVLWGILQPCVFEHPRAWSDRDRAIITQVLERLTPVAVNYVLLNGSGGI